MTSNKRPRSDPLPSSDIPDWLRDSGLPPSTLRSVMDWMTIEGLVFAYSSRIEYHREEERFAHPVRVEIAVGYKGYRERTVCETCCEACPCCSTPCDDLYDSEDPEKPHDQVCYHCLERSCDHAFPKQCPCCGKGCHEVVVAPTRIGLHKDCCLRCQDEDCYHIPEVPMPQFQVERVASSVVGREPLYPVGMK